MERTTNINSNYVCHCARIRHDELLEMFSEAPDPCYDYFKKRYGVGDQCASCEFEVKAILDDYIGHAGDIKRAKVVSPKVPLRSRVQAWLTAKKRKLERAIFPKINNRNSLFFINEPALKSSLIIANMARPEMDSNPNGSRVRFDVRLYRLDGSLAAHRRSLFIRSNATMELSAEELLGSVADGFVGSIFIDYYNLNVTNSLRAYCALNYFDGDGRLLSRQLYHDKYFTRTSPGFVENPCVMEEGHDCFLAIVNCIDRPVTGTLCLETGGKVLKVPLTLGGFNSYWKSVREAFGLTVHDSARGRFWIEGDYFMTYFFWFLPKTKSLFGQHH